MTTSLAIIPRTLDEATEMAERLSKSNLLPKDMVGKMADVLVTIMAGVEMGFAPLASLRAFHVVGGKPVLSADGMIALVLGSGKAVYFDRVEESDTAVTYETLRIGSKVPRRCTWTMAMAKTASLNNKDVWRAYPRAMLASRAKAELARDVYPDVLTGCVTDDEIGGRASPPITIDNAVDAELATLAERCTVAASLADLKALLPQCAALPQGAERDLTRKAYADREKELHAAVSE